MNFFKKSVSALILFSLPSYVCAFAPKSSPEFFMAKALVANYSYVVQNSIPALIDLRSPFQYYDQLVSCFHKAFIYSGILFRMNTLGSDYDEIRFIYNYIRDIIVKCFEYARQGFLNDIINNMNMDSLSNSGLNLFENLCKTLPINLHSRVRILNFDKAIFKSLMQTSPDIWLSYMCDKCKSEDDNDNHYDGIKQIFDYQYNYLNDNPNYLTE